MKTVRTLAILLMACALAIFATWWHSRGDTPSRPTVDQAVVSHARNIAAAEGGAALPTARKPAVKAPPALPPDDAPLASILDPLQHRADAGDHKAACRLAMELLRCRNMMLFNDRGMLVNSEIETSLEAKGDFAAADARAEFTLRQVGHLEQCEAIAPALVERAPHYLVQAARAGEPEAMLRYAKGEHWRPDGRGLLADPEFDVWRREAPGMAHQALAAGIPEAAVQLMFAYGDEFGPLMGLIPDDPFRARAYQLLLFRIGGRGPEPRSKLGASEETRASALADQWHHRYFKGRRGLRGQLGDTNGIWFDPARHPGFCNSGQPN